MKVSLSTLVEIVKITQSSFNGAAPKFIFKRVQEANDPKANYLTFLIIILLILLALMLVSLVLLQSLLEREDSQVSFQSVPSLQLLSVGHSHGADYSKGFINTEETIPQLENLDHVLRKVSSCDKSTECADEHVEDLQEPNPHQKDDSEDGMRILLSAGSPGRSLKWQRKLINPMIEATGELLLFSSSN